MANLSKNCRCHCTYTAMIEGDDAVLESSKDNSYTATVKVQGNDGCNGEPKLDAAATSWAVNPAVKVHIVESKEKSCLINVDKGAAGTFTLTYTPVVKAKCKGTGTEMPCLGQPDTVTINVKAG